MDVLLSLFSNLFKMAEKKYKTCIECEICYHTNLPLVFSKFDSQIGPRSIHINKIPTFLPDNFFITTHLNCESNKNLCDPSWGNQTTDKRIQPGIYNEVGVLLTGDEQKLGAASCALRGLAVLSQKRDILIHGSYVLYSFLKWSGVEPPFIFHDIDILILNRGSDHFKNIIRRYVYTAGIFSSVEIDIVRTTAKNWQETINGRDMNISSIFLVWHDPELDPPVGSLGKYRDNWWFVGLQESITALLSFHGEYYRSDSDTSSKGVKSRKRKEKYIERGFKFDDVPKKIDDTHLNMYIES
jgi:hypothetical protein